MDSLYQVASCKFPSSLIQLVVFQPNYKALCFYIFKRGFQTPSPPNTICENFKKVKRLCFWVFRDCRYERFYGWYTAFLAATLEKDGNNSKHLFSRYSLHSKNFFQKAIIFLLIVEISLLAWRDELKEFIYLKIW